MKYISRIVIIISLILIIGGIVLNFQEALMGHYVIAKNFIVTLVYIIVWIIIIVITMKNKNINIMKYFAVFWILTLSVGILSVLVNISQEISSIMQALFPFSLIFAILFMTQWHGVNFIYRGHIFTSITVTLISLIIVISIILFIKKYNKIQ